MAWRVTADIARYDEAVDWFEKRVPGVDTGRAEDRARGTAFRVAGMMQLSAVQTLFDELKTALEKGTPLAQFKRDVRGKLGMLAPGGALIETTFRNWTQKSYNRGRIEQMRDPATVKFRPYWMFDSILDSRTTEVCKVCNGVIKLHDDPWWNNRVPPLHHRCRSSIRNLRASEAVKRGITEDDPAAGFPPDGTFGRMDDESAERPDLAKVDPGLRAEFERKQLLLAEELRKADEEARRARERAQREDPNYWMGQTFGYAYSDDVKRAVAWGRAMEERGLHMELDAAQKAFDELRGGAELTGPDMGHAIHLGRSRKWIKPKTATVEGAIADLEAAKAAEPNAAYRIDATISALRANAAIVGHMGSIKRAAKGLDVAQVTYSADFPDRQMGEARLAATKEFYRLLRDGSVRVSATNVVHAVKDPNNPGDDLRAYYDNIRNVYLSPRNGANIYIHEFAHALENSARLYETSGKLIEERTPGEQPEMLSVITGIGYGPTERARRDKFADPYTGKVYVAGGKWYASEVLSMALQQLYEDAGKLHRSDPELMWYALGQLAGKRAAKP